MLKRYVLRLNHVKRGGGERQRLYKLEAFVDHLMLLMLSTATLSPERAVQQNPLSNKPMISPMSIVAVAAAVPVKRLPV